MRRLGSPIKAVSFDGDGTLWDFEKVMRGGLRKVLDEFRRALDDPRALEVGVDDLIRLRDEVAASVPGPEQNHERIRRASFVVLLERFGVSDERLADRLAETYFTHRFGVIELYDDTLATLAALAGRYRVGLTSNGNNYPGRFGLSDTLRLPCCFPKNAGSPNPIPVFIERHFAGAARRRKKRSTSGTPSSTMSKAPKGRGSTPYG